MSVGMGTVCVGFLAGGEEQTQPSQNRGGAYVERRGEQEIK